MTKQALRVFYMIAVLLAFVAVTTAQAQKGTWVEHQRKGGLAGLISYKTVGEYCLAYTASPDSVITVYDLAAGVWRDYTHPSAQIWRAAPATDGNVVLVWSNTLVVGYSNLTQTFVPLTYSGTQLGFDQGFGCRGSIAYFVTSEFLYIFDGESGEWYSLAYTKPTTDVSKINIFVGYGPEFLFFALSNSAGWVQQTYVGYSYTTKTLTEFPGEYMAYALLNSGFVFYRNAPLADSANHFIGAWSASGGFTGTIPMANPQPATRSDFALADEISHSFMFVDLSVVDEGAGTNHCELYGFDDRFGGFVQSGFDYTADCSVNCPWFSAGGGEFAFTAERLMSEGGSLDFHIFDGASNAFSTFESDLTYPVGTTNCNANYSFNQAGGRVMLSWDCGDILGYNVANGANGTYALPALAAGTGEVTAADVNDNWGVYLCQRSGSTTMHMYSYHAPDNNFSELTATSAEAAVFYDTTNVAAVYARNTAPESYKLHIYSPGTDSWVTKDFLDIQPIIRLQRDFIYFYDISLYGSDLVVFDGITGQETAFDFGWATGTEVNANSYYNANFLLVYSNTGWHYGYSTYTRTHSQYQGPRAVSRYGTNDLVVMLPESGTPNKQVLAYNVLFDNFVPYTLTTEQGTYTGAPLVGKKTALLITSGGYLLAFDPYKSTPTAVEDDPAAGDLLPASFGVSQNYPNPFNPDTRIDFTLPERSEVRVEVFNTLGQRVRLLLNESRPAGNHTVYWDGRDGTGAPAASGVYLYRVTAGDNVAARKMVMLK